MKIVTLTFHKAINYGAVLQAYALVEKIRELGYDDVKIYDYDNQHIKASYRLFRTGGGIKGLIAQCICFPIKAVKHYKFRRFVKKNIPMVKKPDENDFFITGSDQVWNYRASDFDKTYFLDFAGRKECRNSYAASFGFSEVPEEHKEEYSRLLNNFENISVREAAGVDIVRSLTGREVPMVLDPVMLIDKNGWSHFAGKRKEKYILLYLMAKTPSIIEYANKLAEKTGMKVYYINDYARGLGANFVYKRAAGPEQWLDLMYNAEYVVTNSFHGTAFSICMEKNFYVELLPEGFDVNSRLTNILSSFGLLGRIIDKSSEVFTDSVNYENVNKLFNEKRNESVEYLRQILRTAESESR